MSQRYYGSICISDLLQKVKDGHSSISKSDKNNKLYASVNIWVNDEPDEYGNMVSAALNSTQQGKVRDGKTTYLGNFKKSEPKPITDRDIAAVDDVLNSNIDSNTKSDISEPVDDLPF